VLERSGYEAALADKPVVIRRHFSVFVRMNALAQSRIGIIVSKKVARRAVDRNRIKRLVRETFRRDRWRLGNNDLVVMARRCPLHGGWDGAREELAAVFVQLARRQSPQSE
jgi:ribonuclease P protein component